MRNTKQLLITSIFILFTTILSSTELFWYGNIDSNWSTAGNWYYFDDPLNFTGPHQCLSVPSSSDNINIYPSSHWVTQGYPAYTYNCNADDWSDHACNDLIIHSGAQLTNSTNDGQGVLYVYGSFQCDGDYIHMGTQYLNLVGNGKTISGSGNLYAGDGAPISIGKIVSPEDNTGSYTITSDIKVTHIYVVNTGGYKSSLTINSGVCVTTSYFFQEGTCNLNGTLEITGRACSGTEAIAYPGSPTGTCGGVLGSKNPYFNNSELTLGTNSIIRYCSGKYTGYSSNYADFYGAKDQTVTSDITYENLEILTNNGYIVTIGDGSDVNVSKNLSILNSGTAGGNATTNDDVSISGDFNLGTSGNALELTISDNARIYGDGGDTFTMGNDSHTINVEYNSATYSAIEGYGTAITFYGDVIYKGSGSTNTQIVMGGGGAIYNNIEIDNDATPTAGQNYGVLLSGNLTINGTLTLSDGILLTNGKDLTIASQTGSGVAEGAGNSIYVNSWISGSFKRNITSNTDVYDFPVGTNTNSHLAKMTNNMLVGTSNITAFFTNGDPGNGDSGMPLEESGTTLSRINDGGFWTLNPDAQPSAGRYDLELFFNENSNFTNTLEDGKFTIVSRTNNTSDWELIGGKVNTSVSDKYTKRTGLDSFSEKGIAESDFILPVKLLYFIANQIDNQTILTWETASEVNSKSFTIQKSFDGINFEEIGVVKTKGDCNSGYQYTFYDNPELKTVYYRLAQTDLDNTKTYFNIISLNPYLINTSVQIYPNPISDNLFITTDRPGVEARLVNINGQIVKEFTLFDNTNKINIEELPKGVYILTLISTNESFKLIKI